MGNCFTKNRNDGDDSDHNVEFTGGNVQLITTKESWEQKLEEAKRDGKIIVNKGFMSYLIASNNARQFLKVKQALDKENVLANFSATWCGPCRIIAPFYVELSEKHPSLMCLTVDVDELTEFSTSWDIKATPTFFFLKDGQQIDKLVGANKPELEKKVIAILDSIAPPCQT